jgi:transcriptional antiterminator NusG
MHDDLSEPQWFALQTLSNQEYKVRTNIETILRENSLEDVILEVLVPSENVSEIKSGKKYTRVRKFYPGYVFVRLRMYDKLGEILQSVWQLIRNANGVVRFVGNNNPVALKEAEIDDIMAKMKAVDGKSVPKISYDVGEVVKISDGPFLNLTGEIEAIDSDAGRLRVQVSMFGRLTPVDLEFWQVKRLEPGGS